MISPRRCAAVLASSLLLGLALPHAPATAATAKPAAKTTTTTTKTTVKSVMTTSAAPAKATAKAETPAVPTLASRLAAVKSAKSLNYYPSGGGWSKMWMDWNPAKIDADLAKADALGADNVRVIIFPTTFGWPKPWYAYQDKLAAFVDMAAARGMTVKFTLFDWWDGYEEVANSVSWANTVLSRYKDDKRVISVELQNEFNANDAAAVAWAKKMVPAMRASFPTMPLTFSVDGTSGAPGMAKIKSALASTPIDYFDFHFYGNSERALAVIQNAQATVAPYPMVIGEVGLNTLQNTEGEQAAFLARVFEAAEVAGVRSVAPWTLNDFAQGAIPSSAVSRIPAQYNYGLYRLDGSAKPAAAVVKAGWTNTAMPASLMDPSFELSAGQSPWRAYMPELGLAVKTQSAARTGKWSISLTNTGKTSAGSPSYRVSPVDPVKAGQKWRGEVWAKGSAATGTTQIALSWFDAKDKWLGGATSTWLPVGTTGWTKLVVDGVAPAGSTSMQVHLKSGENKGTVWFDDAVITAS
ncbi:cellulase family glycosylhydrolase [Actinoplanes sp. TRM 88003]|uniref:Cellulase family glycosylhydrolase n=1 Tax=Paractinoplanes aksuensis TaxID=2939490 RepID=A0ABT1DIN8_9ACTN|nr:cellulase family glycosylhydrolase [Actinoplanes aksuensis]MCO8270691.1 cellulase family glycosylhydrolase [Actinoplanes aksuensis]